MAIATYESNTAWLLMEGVGRVMEKQREEEEGKEDGAVRFDNGLLWVTGGIVIP